MTVINMAKAAVTRAVFGVHAFVAIWRVVESKGGDKFYWLLTVTITLLVFEGIVSICSRRGEEMRWFCPSVFFYLCSVVPPIWLLELDLAGMAREGAESARHQLQPASSSSPLLIPRIAGNDSSFATVPAGSPAAPLDAAVFDVFPNGGADNPFKPPHLMGQEDLPVSEIQKKVVVLHILAAAIPRGMWAKVLEQTLLVILIMGRWILPKGELTRDQLSQLLLVYTGMAADIAETFEALREPQVVKNRELTYVILGVWSWSLIQFTLVLTSTKGRKPRLGGDSPPSSTTDNLKTSVYVRPPPTTTTTTAAGTGAVDGRASSSSAAAAAPSQQRAVSGVFGDAGTSAVDSPYWDRRVDRIIAEVEDDIRQRKKRKKSFSIDIGIIAICTTVFLQDCPFLVVRLTLILHYKVVSYSNLLFTCKNTLVITLQLYRLMVLLCARLQVNKSGMSCIPGMNNKSSTASNSFRDEGNVEDEEDEAGGNRSNGDDEDDREFAESDCESRIGGRRTESASQFSMHLSAAEISETMGRLKTGRELTGRSYIPHTTRPPSEDLNRSRKITLSNNAMFGSANNSDNTDLLSQMAAELAGIFNDPEKLKEWLAKELLTPSPVGPSNARLWDVDGHQQSLASSSHGSGTRKLSEQTSMTAMTPIHEEPPITNDYHSRNNSQEAETSGTGKTILKHRSISERASSTESITPKQTPTSRSKNVGKRLEKENYSSYGDGHCDQPSKMERGTDRAMAAKTQNSSKQVRTGRGQQGKTQKTNKNQESDDDLHQAHHRTGSSETDDSEGTHIDPQCHEYKRRGTVKMKRTKNPSTTSEGAAFGNRSKTFKASPKHRAVLSRENKRAQRLGHDSSSRTSGSNNSNASSSESFPEEELTKKKAKKGLQGHECRVPNVKSKNRVKASESFGTMEELQKSKRGLPDADGSRMRGHIRHHHHSERIKKKDISSDEFSSQELELDQAMHALQIDQKDSEAMHKMMNKFCTKWRRKVSGTSQGSRPRSAAFGYGGNLPSPRKPGPQASDVPRQWYYIGQGSSESASPGSLQRFSAGALQQEFQPHQHRSPDVEHSGFFTHQEQQEEVDEVYAPNLGYQAPFESAKRSNNPFIEPEARAATPMASLHKAASTLCLFDMHPSSRNSAYPSDMMEGAARPFSEQMTMATDYAYGQQQPMLSRTGSVAQLAHHLGTSQQHIKGMAGSQSLLKLAIADDRKSADQYNRQHPFMMSREKRMTSQQQFRKLNPAIARITKEVGAGGLPIRPRSPHGQQPSAAKMYGADSTSVVSLPTMVDEAAWRDPTTGGNLMFY